MQKTKKCSRLFAVFLTFVLVFTLMAEPITVFAETLGTTKHEEYELEYWGYDFRNSGLPNAYDPILDSPSETSPSTYANRGYFSGSNAKYATDFYYWKDSDGKISYCVQFQVDNVSSSVMEEFELDNATNYYNASQIRNLKYATIYSYKGTTKYGYTWEEELVASQCLVWAISARYFDGSTTGLGTNETKLLNCITCTRSNASTHLANVKACYKKMKADILGHKNIPQNTYEDKNAAVNNPKTLTYNPYYNNWSAVITSNSTMTQYDLENSISGVTVKHSGNNLTITATNAAAKTLANMTAVTLERTKSTSGNAIEECTPIFLATKSGSTTSQAKVSYYNNPDPVNAYVAFELAEGGDLEVTKLINNGGTAEAVTDYEYIYYDEDLGANVKCLWDKRQKYNESTGEWELLKTEYNGAEYNIGLRNIIRFKIKTTFGQYVKGSNTATAGSGSFRFTGFTDNPDEAGVFYLSYGNGNEGDAPVGTMVITGLPAAPYTIEELNSQYATFADYGLTSTSITTSVNNGTTVERSITNKLVSPGDLNIHKNFKFADDYAATDEHYASVEFKLYNKATDKWVTLSLADVETGTYTVVDMDATEDTATIIKLGTVSKTATIKAIGAGEFIVYELNSDNFVAESSSLTVTMTSTGEQTVVFNNTEKQGRLHLTKDAITQNVTNNEKNNIENIMFYVIGTSATGREVYLEGYTNENGELIIENIPIGEYEVYEEGSSVPVGFLTADKQNVTIEFNQTTEVEFENTQMEGTIVVQKTTSNGNTTAISGITFRLVGNPHVGGHVDLTATSDANGRCSFTNLPIGDYEVYEEESSVPVGYITADSQTVTVEHDKTATITFENDTTKVEISKLSALNNTPLAGAVLQILDGTTVIEEWTSTTQPHLIEAKLKAGKQYTLHEVSAPTGYVVSGDITFNVSTDGSVDGLSMTDLTTKVDITKYSAFDNQPLAGAVLQVLDGTTVIEEWTSTTSAHRIEAKLEAGKTYTLHEATPAKGHVIAADVTFTVSTDGSVDDVTMYDLTTKVDITKYSELDNKPLAGAVLQVLDGTTVIEEWTSTTSAHRIEAKLEAGKTYTLHEVSAPKGFVLASDKTFTVSTDGSIDVVSMTDLTTKVDITKYSGLDNSPLAGAVLQVLDGTTVIEEWTSTTSAHRIEAKLEAGKQYTLHEVSAPKGYVVAKDITFTVATNGSVDNVSMVDLTTKVQISKQNITNGNELPGAKLQVLDTNGNVIEEWISTSTPHYIEAKLEANATYTLHEEVPADGFVIANDIDFTVSSDGSIDTVVMKDDTTKLEVTKVSAMTNTPLAGAVLQILDGKTVVEEWTSTTSAHRIEAKLVAGKTYTLHEVSAPAGFIVAKDITFTVSTTGILDTVTMIDLYTRVEISKYDITGDKELAGATLSVLDKNGTAIETWVSDGTTHVINGVLIAGETYTLREEIAPNGYVISNDVTFTVSLDGSVDTVEMYDDHTKVEITKYSELDNKPLAGAVLQVLDGTTVIDEWTSTTSAHVINAKLVAGKTYTLHEVSAPSGHVLSADKTFTVSTNGSVDVVSMVDLTTKVQISKQNITNGEELPGATLQVIDKNGQVIDEWISTTTPHLIEAKLIAGETYTLHEEISPDGFVIANDATFTVSTDGSVDEVVMKDDTTKVQFSKQDMVDGSELPGAKLKIVDASGNTIEQWTSTSTPHLIEGKLIAGKSYTLIEESAPEGFLVAESVTFTVSTDGSIDRVVMKDARIRGTIILTKVDKDYPDNKLTGAVFEVYKDVDGDGKYSAVDILVDVMTEREIGIYVLEVDYGKYLVHEKTAPEGFLLDTGYYSVFVSEHGKDYEIENEAGVGFINNEAKGSVSLQKMTEGMVNIEGILFILEGVSNYGNPVYMEEYSDSEGRVLFENVPEGEYTVYEDESTVVYGYVKAEAQKVTVVGGQTSELTFINEEMTGSLKIVKTTSDSNPSAVSNIRFFMSGKTLTGREIEPFEVYTDENGEIYLPSLVLGEYEIREDSNSVPVGYLTADSQVVTLDTSELKTITVVNKKAPDRPDVPETGNEKPLNNIVIASLIALLCVYGIYKLRKENEVE